MTPRTRIGRALGAALLAGVVLSACETDRSTVFNPVGVPAFDFVVTTGAAGLPSGTATVGASSVTISASNLRALGGGRQYQFWVLGRDAANLDVPVQAFGAVKEFFLFADGTDPVTGDTIFSTDSTTISDVSIAGYAGSDDPMVTSVRVTIDSVADGTDPTTYHAVFLSLETAAASTPGTARFMWRRIGVGGSGSMSFGNFGGSDVINVVSPQDYIFGARGAGLGGARGGEVSVDLTEVARPPVGFYYRGYITRLDGTGVVVDTVRAPWSPDGAISRVSLYDADVNDLLPNVVNNEIRAINIRNCATGSGVGGCQNSMDLPATDTFDGFARFQLKLEPKGGAGASPRRSISHVGELPDEVK
jgi:hypothetical protein